MFSSSNLGYVEHVFPRVGALTNLQVPYTNLVLFLSFPYRKSTKGYYLIPIGRFFPSKRDDGKRR